LIYPGRYDRKRKRFQRVATYLKHAVRAVNRCPAKDLPVDWPLSFSRKAPAQACQGKIRLDLKIISMPLNIHIMYIMSNKKCASRGLAKILWYDAFKNTKGALYKT
jgi:hypothetical protein